LKKYTEALECFNKAIDVDPENEAAICRKSLALIRMKDYEGALLSAKKAIKISPESVYAWHAKGKALLGLKKYKEGLKCFRKIIKIDPAYADFRAEELWVFKTLISQNLPVELRGMVYEEELFL